MKLSIQKGQNLRCGLGLLAGVAMVLYAIPVRAGSSSTKLVQIESTFQTTVTSETFGPTGCDPNAGTCAYINLTASSMGQSTPFGPYTLTGTDTILFGPGFKYATPNGAHDNAGNSTGLCFPETGTSTETYADGSTLTLSTQGTVCSASTDFSQPLVNHVAAAITGGSGRFAGVTGSDMESFSSIANSSGEINVGTSQGVIAFPGK